MFFLKSKNKFLYLLIALLVISEVIVNPTGNYCLNDDWTYAKSVLKLFLGGKYDIGTSSASIWTHLMWGLFFVKLFGFSLFILRVSSIVSAIIGLVVLYKLVSKITHTHTWIPFTACGVLLFNPIYFNLMNSYMTDVNFTTLLICCVYFSYNFFNTGSVWQFVLVFLSALLLVLLRQFGIIFPLCMSFACLFLKEKKLFYTIFGTALTLCIIVIFKYYEHYVEVNHCAEGYQSSAKIALFDLLFWEKILLAFKLRYQQMIINTMVFTLPFLIIFLPALIRKTKLFILIPLILFSFGSGFYLFYDMSFLIGNVFVNMNVGAETFFQTLNPFVRAPNSHTYSLTFEIVLKYLSSISASLFFMIIFLAFRSVFLDTTHKFKWSSSTIYFSTLIFSYMCLLLIFDSYIDRYNIPLFALIIIAASYLTHYISATTLPAFIFLIGFYYIAVFGTKDYLSLNFKKAEAYNYLRFEKKVPMHLINAGYEMNLWHEGKHVVSYEPVFLDNHRYLIQYRQEPGFNIYKEYEFQRYFPYKKDKIYIFVRQDKK